jgi:hypothetical protein
MKRPVIVVALLSTLTLVTSNSALASGPPTRVSHGDPFASCLGGGNSDPRTMNFQSAEVEPWIASNPANSNNLIGSWQQDRWSDGGAKGQVASWSFDGGKTWGQTPQPFTTCAQPFYKTPVLQYQRASDPWVSIGPDGTAYAVSLIFDGDSIRNGLGAAVSLDGGKTWIRQKDIDPLVARADTLDPSDDKESVTADPLHPGWAYAVWDHFVDVFVCPSGPSRAAVRSGHDNVHRNTRAATTSATPCGFSAPTYLSRTTNFGRTWSKPKLIVPTAVDEQTIDNQILVNHQTGTLYDFYNYINAAGEDNIEMVFSTNRGATWSPRQHVQRLATNAETNLQCLCGVTYPGDESKPLRTGDTVPSFAIDPNTGQLYVVWQDGRANPVSGAKNDMLFASTSTRGGLPGTWSHPIRVNPGNDRAAFTAAINVNGSGQVGIAYYDLTPPLTSPDILLTDTWLVTTDGPGLAFGPRKLIGGPYNMLAAPFALGFFVGDYMGLAAPIGNQGGDGATAQKVGQADESGFTPLFVMTNCRDNSCRAVGTPDGTPAGPDSTDAFTRAPSG